MKPIELENLIKKSLIDVLTNDKFSKFFIDNIAEGVIHKFRKDKVFINEVNKVTRKALKEFIVVESEEKDVDEDVDETESFLEQFRPIER